MFAQVQHVINGSRI